MALYFSLRNLQWLSPIEVRCVESILWKSIWIHRDSQGNLWISLELWTTGSSYNHFLLGLATKWRVPSTHHSPGWAAASTFWMLGLQVCATIAKQITVFVWHVKAIEILLLPILLPDLTLFYSHVELGRVDMCSLPGLASRTVFLFIICAYLSFVCSSVKWE